MSGEGTGKTEGMGLGQLAAVLLLAAIIAGAVVYGFGPLLFFDQHGPRNDLYSVASMRSYLAAQSIFHRTDHDGDGVLEYCGPSNPESPSFTCLNTTVRDGKPIELISGSFAGATSAAAPISGYWFVDMKSRAGKPFDAAKEFGLCGVPAEYGRTGRDTLIIGEEGTTYRKDTGGKPVTDFPADPAAEGWIVCE
jgi:hypothetical protein